MISNKYRGMIKGAKGTNREFSWAYGNLVEELSTGRCFIVDLAYMKEDTNFSEIALEVYPPTVGRYTGINDINGNEIYEKDIVKGLGENKGASVVFYGDIGELQPMSYLNDYNGDNYEVVSFDPFQLDKSLKIEKWVNGQEIKPRGL